MSLDNWFKEKHLFLRSIGKIQAGGCLKERLGKLFCKGLLSLRSHLLRFF